MNEDDTFRILSRISWDEMNKIRRAAFTLKPGIDGDPFFRQYGWSVIEFMKEFELRKKSSSDSRSTYKLIVSQHITYWGPIDD